MSYSVVKFLSSNSRARGTAQRQKIQHPECPERSPAVFRVAVEGRVERCGFDRNQLLNLDDFLVGSAFLEPVLSPVEGWRSSS